MKKLLRIVVIVLLHIMSAFAGAAVLVTLTAMPSHVCGPDAGAGFASVGRFILFAVMMVSLHKLAKAIAQEPLP